MDPFADFFQNRTAVFFLTLLTAGVILYPTINYQPWLASGDHGRDLTKADQVPTREYVPLLATGPKLAQGVNLGVRASAADLGHTIVEALQGDQLPVGESFLNALRAG